MPTERNRQIRERAYSLWEADGSPEGREWDYWLRAEQDLDAEAQTPKRGAKTSSTRTAKSGTSSKSAAKTKTAAKPKTAAKRASTKKTAAAKS